MKVCGAAQSPFVRKVLVVLEEKGLSYDLEPPDPALHPMGKMPVLVDGEHVIPDSTVICAYLEKRHPTPALYPDSPGELARALFLEEYADTQMSEDMGAIVLESLIKPQFLGQPTDQARLAALREAVKMRWTGTPCSAAGTPVPSVLDYLESVLPNDRDTVLPRFSIADAALGVHLGWLPFTGLALDAKRWPRTARFQAAIARRPSFAATSIANGG
jgi:glutathione S-transferase